MKESVAATLFTIAYTGAAIAAATQPISEEQALVYAISAGLAGGAIASVLGKAVLTWRSVIAKVLSSGAVAPVLVMLTMRAEAQDGAVVYTIMPVVSYSLVAGLFGWMLVELAAAAIRKVTADDVRAWARGLMPRGWGDKDKGDTP